MAICSVSVVPLGTGTTSFSTYVAGCHDILKKVEGIKYRLTPMATILEGDLDLIMKVIAELHRSPFDVGAKRVMTLVNIDDRADKEITMDSKVESVKRRLGE